MPQPKMPLRVVGHGAQFVERQAQKVFVRKRLLHHLEGEDASDKLQDLLQLLRQGHVPLLRCQPLDLEDGRLEAVHLSPEGDARVSLGHQDIGVQVRQVFRLDGEHPAVRADEARLEWGRLLRPPPAGVLGHGRRVGPGAVFRPLLPLHDQLDFTLVQELTRRGRHEGTRLDRVAFDLLPTQLFPKIPFRQRFHGNGPPFPATRRARSGTADAPHCRNVKNAVRRRAGRIRKNSVYRAYWAAQFAG